MKTIDDAANNYAFGKSSSNVFNKAHIEDFKAGVEFAQRWTPIEDELPPLNTYILTKGTKGEQVYYNSIIMTKLPPIDILKQFYFHWRLIELE